MGLFIFFLHVVLYFIYFCFYLCSFCVCVPVFIVYVNVLCVFVVACVDTGMEGHVEARANLRALPCSLLPCSSLIGLGCLLMSSLPPPPLNSVGTDAHAHMPSLTWVLGSELVALCLYASVKLSRLLSTSVIFRLCAC